MDLDDIICCFTNAMRIIYYTTEHARVWFKEWLTFKFVEISIGKFPAYKENSVICMPWVEHGTIIRTGITCKKISL